MFTGIVESTGLVREIVSSGNNKTFTFSCSFTSSLKIDQSLSHNGVCLTVIAIENDCYQVTAIDETLKRTNLGGLQVGDSVNLERCMKADSRFDGHIVQGHVDETGICRKIRSLNGSWEFVFEYDSSSSNITVEKGSICVNGVSLTVVRSEKNLFSVHVIPYTYEHTTFHLLRVNDRVNLEFDIVGKYIRRLMNAG
jgi:riboflavin synthase